MQRGEHCSEFHGPLRELQRKIPFQEIELLREEDLVFQFSAGAKCNANEVSGFRSGCVPRLPRCWRLQKWLTGAFD